MANTIEETDRRRFEQAGHSRLATSRRGFIASLGGAVILPTVVRSFADEPRSANFRIDCQSHLYPPELLALMEKRNTPPLVRREGTDRFVVVGEWTRKVLPKHSDVEAKLADMDAHGIRLTALSINDPGPELFDRDGTAVARICNDYIADVVRRHPRRFLGLAVLPLQNMKDAIIELDRCHKNGLRGILLYSNLAGKFPDEPEFRPLFARAEELDLPVLLHPAYPTTFDAVKGYEMAGGLGLMFDTTIALTRLILSGIFEDHPRLKLVCPHAGGTLPYLVGRIDHQTQVLKRGAARLKRKPSEYLREVYLDTVCPHAASLRCAIETVGIEKLIFSTDHPWVAPKLIVDTLDALQLSEADQRKVYGDNARRLFSL